MIFGCHATLVAIIGFWTPLAQAAEPSFDVLSHALHTYAGPVDENAAEAAPEAGTPPERGARLAAIQADLSLMAEGFEAFRHPSQAQHALQDLPDYVVPELRSFFKDRDSTLDTVYRTLAVTDYTWALRFPEPTCDPRTRRKILLDSKDGLFIDPKSGDLSPWLARLLGPAARGRTAEEALDRASSKQTLSPRDYELLRVKAAKITEALRSDKAVGKERAKLYCLRADAYETLASAHQAAEGGPIQASRATDGANPTDKEGASVLLIAVTEGTDGYNTVGAGVVVETAHGRKVLTDASLQRAGREAKSILYGFTRANDGTLDKPRVINIERTDQNTNVLIGSIQGAEGIPALKISQHPVVRQDLVRAIGHVSAGTWTVGQGLVTATGRGTFASDAILGPDMRGGPLLNDVGEVVGLVVLSPQGPPTAIMPERLRELTDGDAPITVSSDIQFIESRQTGSGAILTASNPNYIYTQTPYGTVRGRCIGCDSTPKSSYSSGSSGGTQIGEALGQAMAPLVEDMIFKGIPALFRGIGNLFKKKSAPQQTLVDNRQHSAPTASEQPKPPEDPLRPTSIKLSASRLLLAQGETLQAVATVGFAGKDGSIAGRGVSFTVAPGGKLTCTSGSTDAAGVARTTCKALESGRDQRFDSLQDEVRRKMGMKTAGRVRREPPKSDKVATLKEKEASAMEALNGEEGKHPGLGSEGSDTPGIDKPIPETEVATLEIKGDRITLSASIDKYQDQADLDILERPCFDGSTPVRVEALSRYRCRSDYPAENRGPGDQGVNKAEAPSEDALPGDGDAKPGNEEKPDPSPPESEGKKRRNRRTDLPVRGEPNSSGSKDLGDGKGQIREYDSEGRAEKDHDFGHDHGQGDPHTHDWDWTDPEKPVRGPGRPLKPGE